MTVNDDGSTDIYIGRQPAPGQEQNWIPTAGRDLWLLCRFYGPEKALFEKTWITNDVVEVT